MAFCTNCGAKLNPTAEFCSTCGARTEQAKEVVQETVKKPIVVKEEPKKVEKIPAVQHVYSDSIKLWTWLKRESKRQQYFTEEIPEIEETYFVDLVSQKMEDNCVPAKIERCEVRWDLNSISRKGYYIKPETDVINPFTCLVQFKTVGKFSFVEEKTFITPPDLPNNLMKPMALSQDLIQKRNLLLSGIIMFVLGIALWGLSTTVGIILLCAGGAAAVFGGMALKEIKAIEEHNEECERRQKAWDAAWEHWRRTIFTHSFQEDINGQLSRIYDSVFECIKQVSIDMFEQKAAVEESEKTNMNELEELIARRKEEYK